MDETLEAALQKAVGGLSSEAKVEVFTALRRSVPKAQNDILKLWEAKAEVLQFLVEFYEEKQLYHRQVISLLELLLQQPGWASVRKDWPEEMAKVAAAAAKAGGAQEVEAAGGYTASDLPVAPQRSMADTLAMLEDSLQRLSDANFSFTLLTGSGLEEDDLLKAYELFRRAVCRVNQDQRIEMSVLDQIGRKESILQFLLEVMDRKPRHKKRIESLLLLLLQLESWRRVAENESLKDATAKYRGNLEKEEDANTNDADVDVPSDDVKELLADAKRRGAIGILLVRVVAAYDLVNADWFSLSDPYAKVTVDKVSKTTAVVDDCLDPCWDEDLWNFDVMAESSFVRLEVWDKDSVQDDPLGSVAIPITMTPSELKNLRFQLDRVAHGELEVEMQFIRVEMDETDETGEPELLKSGGRKLPGPKAQGS